MKLCLQVELEFEFIEQDDSVSLEQITKCITEAIEGEFESKYYMEELNIDIDSVKVLVIS